LKGAEELEECQTKLIDLRDYQLLFCDGKDDESQFPKDVFRLREEVKQAHGMTTGLSKATARSFSARPSIMAATVAS
jgi:hypothetical protein